MVWFSRYSRWRRLASEARFVVVSALSLALGLVGCDAGEARWPAATGEGAGQSPPAASSGADPAASGATFEVLRNRAFQLLERQGPTEEVLAALARAHARDTAAYGVNVRMARVQAALQRPAEALHHDELALAARPDDLATRADLLGLCLLLGRAERVLELVDPLLADARWVGQATAIKARALDELGRRAEALALLESSRELPLDQAGPCLTLHGRLLFEAGELEAAHERFAAALALAADDQAAVRGLADTCRRLGRDLEADRWDEVLGLFLALRDNRFTRPAAPQRDRKGQRQAGRRSEYIGREQAAQVARLRRLIELHPRWPGAWEQLAELLRREGDQGGACRTVQDLLAHHGALYDAARRRQLLQRFCEEDD